MSHRELLPRQHGLRDASKEILLQCDAAHLCQSRQGGWKARIVPLQLVALEVEGVKSGAARQRLG